MNAVGYRRYLLGVLLSIYGFNFVDRCAFALVLQDVKADLHLTDTQLGVLTGIAFALFYAVMGIPIARWADKGNRKLIISITTATWGLLVSACGLATTFMQLMMLRVGVAIGEAGCLPPAHSLIADHFTREERPRAVGVYMLGLSASAIVGFFIAGWLSQLYGWRIMFVLLGLPGPVLAVIAWFTLREPRQGADGARGPAISRVPTIAGEQTTKPDCESLARTDGTLLQVAMTLWSNKTFRHLLLYFSLASLFDFAVVQWRPAFLMRSYGMQTGELGTWLAALYGLGGICGTYLGGYWASGRAAGNERLQLQVVAVTIVLYGAISASVYLSPNRYWALGLMGVSSIAVASTYAPLYATVQTLLPEHMRATAVASIALFSNLIGMGLGPLMTGAMSDALRPWAGEQSLRFALLALSPGYLWCVWHLWRASKTVGEDLRAARMLAHAPGISEGGCIDAT
jgi:MFS family permease